MVVAVAVGQRQAGSQADLGAHDPVAAVEIGFGREHVHRAALSARRPRGAAGEFRHHLLGIHAARQHVAMLAIAGDHLIPWLLRRLDADGDRLLADVQVAEATDQSHAVKLTRPLLEAADQQHVPIVFQQFGFAAVLGAVDVGPEGLVIVDAVGFPPTGRAGLLTRHAYLRDPSAGLHRTRERALGLHADHIVPRIGEA